MIYFYYINQYKFNFLLVLILLPTAKLNSYPKNINYLNNP
nr:MAG TPA: hypothetical protein [Caudoviricetes sp.]